MTEDLSPRARELLQSARSALSPDEAQLAALLAAVQAEVQAPVAARPATPRPTLWHAARLAIALLTAASAYLATQGWSRSKPAASPAPAAANSEWHPPAGTQPVGPVPSSAAPATVTVTKPPREHEARRQPTRVDAAQDSLAAELALLQQARSALDQGRARQALRLLERHAQRFPNGTLRQERLATRALAWCALGRADTAAQSIREIERIAADSPYLERIRSRCARTAP